MTASTGSGIFSLPLELHANISHFAAPASLITLSKTCHTAYRIYKPLYIERLVYLTRISITHASPSSILEHDPNETDMSRAVNGAFHEQLVDSLARRAPVHIVMEFFEKLGWDVKKNLTLNYSDNLAEIVDVNKVYTASTLPPYLSLLPLQVLSRLIVQIPENTWKCLDFFIHDFSDLCKPTPGFPHPQDSPKANYALPEFRYLNTLDLGNSSSLRNIVLFIILAKNIGSNLNTYAMPYYVPWFHLHYPQIAEFLMSCGLSVHAAYPEPPKGPPAKLLRYIIRVNVRMLRLLLSNGVDPNEATPIASCSLQRAVSGVNPHVSRYVQMRAVELLFSGHVLPGFGDVEETGAPVLVRRKDMPQICEMVDKAMDCFESLKEFGADVDMAQVEEMCVNGFQQIWNIYGEDVWKESISGNCAYIAMYFVGMGRRLGFRFFEELEVKVPGIKQDKKNGKSRKGKNRGCCIS